MVYGICYYPISKLEDVKSLGLAGEGAVIQHLEISGAVFYRLAHS